MRVPRRRMLEDMQIRNLAAETQESYVRHVGHFARHFGRSPAKLCVDDIRAYNKRASRRLKDLADLDHLP